MDGISYHILLNALAEEDYFNSFSIILSQIRMKDYATSVTNVIVVKFLCKQGKLDEAEVYLNCLLGSGKELYDFEVSFLVGSMLPQNPFLVGSLQRDAQMKCYKRMIKLNVNIIGRIINHNESYSPMVCLVLKGESLCLNLVFGKKKIRLF